MFLWVSLLLGRSEVPPSPPKTTVLADFFWPLLSVSTVHLHCTAVWTQQSCDTAQKNPLASVTSFQMRTSRTCHINECSIVLDHSSLVNSLHETLRDNSTYVLMDKSSHAF